MSQQQHYPVVEHRDDAKRWCVVCKCGYVSPLIDTLRDAEWDAEEHERLTALAEGKS